LASESKLLVSKTEKSPYTLIRYLFTREISSVQSIFGRRGTGKTDFALLIAEILSQLGIIKHFGTNIRIYESPFPIERILSLEDLKYWCKETEGKKLFLFDEVGLTLPRRKPMSSLNVALIQQFQVLRKYKLSTIYLTIDPSYVDNAVLGSQILDGVFEKIWFRRKDSRFQKVALYRDLLEYFEFPIRNIPGTQVKFDTWDSASLTEYSQTRRPVFKDKDLDSLWRWSQGASAEELGLHRAQLSRLRRKFIKETLERQRNREHMKV